MKKIQIKCLKLLCLYLQNTSLSAVEGEANAFAEIASGNALISQADRQYIEDKKFSCF